MRGKGLMIFGLIAGLSGIGFGIYALYRKQIYMAMQYCYKLYKTNLTSFSKDLIQMEIWVKILNRSTFSLTIKSYSLDIIINNYFITNLTNDQETIINPESVNYLKVNLSIKPSDVLKAQLLVDLVKYYLLDQSKIIIKVKGNLSARANFLPIKLPIEYQSSLKELMTPTTGDESLVCPKDF